MDKISLFEAIEEMKQISAAGGTFAFAFRKWNSDTCNGGDVARFAAARLRPKASDEEVRYSSFKLFFTDTETGRQLNCWQPLIIEFNNKQTIL